MMFAIMSGVVKVDRQGCVYLQGGGTRLWAVWPQGFTAYETEGRVTLYDPEGRVAARDGDAIESAGGHIPLDHVPLNKSECLPERGEIAAIHGDVEVISD